MEYYFFIIVIIVLKILFWTFYFYVRAQRLRQARTSQRFIIVGAQPRPGMGRHLRPCSDRSAIINHAEPLAATGPPPYAEVVKDGSMPLPPSYDQVMSGNCTETAAGPAVQDTAVETTAAAYNINSPVYNPSGVSPGGQSVASHGASAGQAHVVRME